MKFAIVSDVHAEQHPDWSRLVFERMGARKDLDFVAFLGDVCTSPGDDWNRWFRPLVNLIKVPLLACRGNHDDKERWHDFWGQADHFARIIGDVHCVFSDSNLWADEKSGFMHVLDELLKGTSRWKFFFTHLSPRIGHWNYGLSEGTTAILREVLYFNGVTACFTGHMHGFDYLKNDGISYFICGGGGGGPHDNFPVMHRSNYYLLCEVHDTFHVTLCQQHRDREQMRPMEEWINETRRPAF